MTTPLRDFSYEIAASDFTFGRGTNVHVESVDFGETTMELATVAQPRADGVRFGRGYFRGRVIIFTGNILNRSSETAAPETLDQLSTAWQPDEIRLTPGAVTSLRWNRAGRTRRVYGRPTRVASTSGRTTQGWIPFVAEFQCVDHLYYSDAEAVEVISIIPPEVGGLEGDLIGDLIASSEGAGQRGLLSQGTKPGWLICQVNGPIINPTIEMVGRWKIELDLTLASDQYVIVDPTPWNRSVLRNDNANMSGAIRSGNSARLSQMKIFPGVNEVLLRGVDPTGTSSVKVYWRDAYTSY